MSCTSVLRIGPITNSESATLLRSALRDHLESSDGDVSRSDSKGSDVLTVTNKYFSAQVVLRGIGEDYPQKQPGQDSSQHKEDGILLVFDALQSNPEVAGSIFSSTSSFEALTSIHDAAEKSGQCGDLLRLCVGVSVGALPRDGGKKQEEDYSRRVLWCLDRGYEYVEADLSEEGVMSGHNEREKDGFARVVEAVVGTVWSSAQMGSRKERLKKVISLGETETSSASEDRNPGREYVPPLSQENTKAVAADSKGEEESTEKQVLSQNSGAEKDFFIPDNSGPANEQEKTFSDFEHVLGEASRIREASRTGMLSDEDRRKRAEDAAVLMMGILDRMGFDDDTDEEEDSSDQE